MKPILTLLLMLHLMSCHDDEYDKPAVVKFAKPSANFSESAGLVKIEVLLDHKRNVDTPLHASWSSSDSSAFLDADFAVGLDFTINAFSTQGYIHLTVFDDVQIDKNDKILLKISSPIDNKVRLAAAPTDSEFSLSIENNDSPMNNMLQADLTWRRPNKHDPINGINWDFYLQRGVSIVNDEIKSVGESFQSSAQPGGFETIKLKDSDPDEEYYLVAYFQQSLVTEYSDYWVSLNGLGFSNDTVGGRLGGEEVGTAIFIGPLTKSEHTVTLGKRRHSPVKVIYASKEVSKRFQK